MINPNADIITLPREIFEGLQDIISEEISNEILEKLRMGC